MTEKLQKIINKYKWFIIILIIIFSIFFNLKIENKKNYEVCCEKCEITYPSDTSHFYYYTEYWLIQEKKLCNLGSDGANRRCLRALLDQKRILCCIECMEKYNIN